MHVPTWWEFTLLALASWRTWVLLAEDVILDSLRLRLLWPVDDEGQPVERERLRDFIQCPYCLGFWCAGAWYGAWLITDSVLYVAALLAIAAAVPLIERARS